MSLFSQALAWSFDGSRWTTTAQATGIAEALGQHLLLTAISLAVTIVVAVPLGLFIGHSGRGRATAIIASNAARALPTLGLLSILILLLGLGYLPPVIVLVLLGIPPLLAGVYAGIESVDRQTIDAARAIGMTELQILFKVEIPLGAALLVGGLRAATLQIIATVAIASYFGITSLGSFLFSGLASADYVQMTAGAILVAALALIADGIFAIVQRFAVPRGVSRGATDGRKTTARGRRLAAVSGTPIKEGN